MPAVTIVPADLTPFATIDLAKAEAMIERALALAAWHAPCIASDDFQYAGAAKAIILDAIQRWHDSGSGAVSSQVAGVFQQTLDTRVPRWGVFTDRDIAQLQEMCKGTSSPRAFEVDLTPPGAGIVESDWYLNGLL